MITEEDKERIKFEEIFREEIRKILREKEQSSFRKKSWKIINSPFGLWLLSTVLVGLVVFFYNDNKLKNEISVNNAATIQKLETETSNRLQHFKLALTNQEPSKIYYQKDDIAYMIDGVIIGDVTYARKKPVYIFPEYKERTMNSLLYEIGRLTIDKKQASTIIKARIILTRIQNDLLKMEDPPKFDFSIGQLIQQKAQSQPENLTPQESKLLIEYEEKEKIFEQGKLSEYHSRIRKKLDSILILFRNNPFLKEMSDN